MTLCWSTPAFVSRLLIQMLTSTNSSPAYVRRVADVFRNNGRGVRGELSAVLRAILTDLVVERPQPGTGAGKLREPYLLLVALFRAFAVVTTVDFSQWRRLDERVRLAPYLVAVSQDAVVVK